MGKGCEEKREARHKKMDKVHIKKRRTAQTVKVTASQRGKETPLLGVNRWRAGEKKNDDIGAGKKRNSCSAIIGFQRKASRAGHALLPFMAHQPLPTQSARAIGVEIA